MIKPFSITTRVYYQDTDTSGVVYHSKYLDFCERARTEFLREQGIVQTELLKNEDTIFVVRNLCIDYTFPAKLDDLLEVSVEIEEVKGVRVKMKQNVLRKDDRKLLARIKLELVTISGRFRPKRISEELRKNLTN